ncbi:MAG: threonine--tRNA ligase [Patescibacteria group bacterium]|nr:threonine--tRNA ligase [Patescibacteria group bacterium]
MTTKQDKLEIMRHSTAHLLAAAVQSLFPNTKLGIGPVIENGFYYDFDLPKAITEADLPKIEEKMRKLQKQDLNFSKSELSLSEATKLMKSKKQDYKVELIEQIKKTGDTALADEEKDITTSPKTPIDKVSFYQTGDFIDLCRGPHINKTSEIGPFKLLSVAGAYWRGNEKNKMLTRIYGTVFATQSDLEKYLQMLEEAKKRDHRVLGKQLGLFVFADLVGKGLPLLTAKGATIRRELERFIVDEEIRRGYLHVITPPLAKVDLYRTSGHYPYYKNTMYPPMKVDEEELILRPMTCPHHFMLYKSQLRSYRDLPIRFAELASQFRYEKSGELTGLMRVRMFCLADSHIFATTQQAPQVINEVLDLIEYVNTVLHLKKGEDYRYRLSLGKREDSSKYYKDDAAWDKAEDTLRQVLIKRDAPFYEAADEAAFYGPKIDIQVKNVLGKEETAFTVQYDFVMPKRFDLKYIDKAGKEQEPIVIHRSSIGAFERTMAFLIEKYSGAFPVWLSPVQIVVIPITSDNNSFAEQINRTLLDSGLRSEVDNKTGTMQGKIREAQLQKIPYMLIVGRREEEAKKVAVRTREGQDLGAMKIEDFIQQIKQTIESKALI